MVFNVVASHAYFADEFLRGVGRVLKPGGLFVLVDSRLTTPPAAETMIANAVRAGSMTLLRFHDVTQNVADTPRREAMLARAPWIARHHVRQMIGVANSPRHLKFALRHATYFIALARRDEPERPG